MRLVDKRCGRRAAGGGWFRGKERGAFELRCAWLPSPAGVRARRVVAPPSSLGAGAAPVGCRGGDGDDAAVRVTEVELHGGPCSAYADAAFFGMAERRGRVRATAIISWVG